MLDSILKFSDITPKFNAVSHVISHGGRRWCKKVNTKLLNICIYTLLSIKISRVGSAVLQKLHAVGRVF